MTDVGKDDGLLMVRLEGVARLRSLPERAAAFQAAFPDWRFPWSVASFAEFAEDPRVLWLEAVFPGNSFAGLALARVVADEAELLTVFRTPCAAGRGVGARLTYAVINELNHQQITQLILEVEQNNHSALSLYERVGFKKVGVRKGYYRGSNATLRDAFVLQLEFNGKK